MEKNINAEKKYLELLAEKFPTVQEVCTEIINLQAILNLPKGTEHFLSDLHGEYESFLHILKNASGVIKAKIDETFQNSMTNEERKKLATLIYYPEEKLELIKKQNDQMEEFYRITLYRLIEVCKVVSSKYSRSKVRKAMPKEYEYIIDELLHAKQNMNDKEFYYNQIINTIIKLDRADAFIIAISKLIQQLAIDHLHIIGDIYDRGPGPHIIIDELMKYHSIDIQWGNHDIIWMGAASGSEACILNVIRICSRYHNLDILEDAYGINLRAITEYAMEEYKEESLPNFKPQNAEKISDLSTIELLAKIQKACAIIQFKLEGQLIKRHPEFKMEDRMLLDKINYETGEVQINGKYYKLLDNYFPTIDPKNPYELTKKEKEVVCKLKKGFLNSEKLQRHVQFLYNKGSLYKIYNNNLLIHGCIPMDKEGNLKYYEDNKNRRLAGRAYLDYIDKIARQGYFSDLDSEEREYGKDFLWYLWCGENSPIFCKDAMKTFERYFVDDKELHKENKNPFYIFAQNEEVCDTLLGEFGIEKDKGHIICGHIPVKFKSGESPIKANGKLLIIDGGLSKSYQKTTGIAGYTLIYNSYGLMLAEHEPFNSRIDAIVKETDLHSSKVVVEKVDRKRIKDTDIGIKLQDEIEDLYKLLECYKLGIIKIKE
ncbi:MAG TPA: fructose-1,6-bisphosphatase [Clostridiaceae bacterium]|nr:fructose-1,6-bisphosphatase [Clostridiaceae bacterium]